MAPIGMLKLLLTSETLRQVANRFSTLLFLRRYCTIPKPKPLLAPVTKTDFIVKYLSTVLRIKYVRNLGYRVPLLTSVNNFTVIYQTCITSKWQFLINLWEYAILWNLTMEWIILYWRDELFPVSSLPWSNYLAKGRYNITSTILHTLMSVFHNTYQVGITNFQK